LLIIHLFQPDLVVFKSHFPTIIPSFYPALYKLIRSGKRLAAKS